MAVSFMELVCHLSSFRCFMLSKESKDSRPGVICQFELDWFSVMEKTIMGHNEIYAFAADHLLLFFSSFG